MACEMQTATRLGYSTQECFATLFWHKHAIPKTMAQTCNTKIDSCIAATREEVVVDPYLPHPPLQEELVHLE